MRLVPIGMSTPGTEKRLDIIISDGKFDQDRQLYKKLYNNLMNLSSNLIAENRHKYTGGSHASGNIALMGISICNNCKMSLVFELSLSGEPDYFGRNKISSGGDLSHYSSASLY